MQDERVSPMVRELAAAGAQQAHSRIGGIASVLGITDEAKINEIAILVGAAILQAYQDGNGATLDVDALIANVVAGIVATEEGGDETGDGEITTVQPELVEVRAPEIWTGHLVDFLDLNELDLDEVPEVLADDFRLGLPGEGLGFEPTWSANRIEAGYEGAIESDEDGDDLTFVVDDLLEP
ncbi:MAG TPA: hypothetical protein QGH28_07965 [Chloroflexota bacterium]|nr:hypothetical protein [Chloroflexota bacterium]